MPPGVDAETRRPGHVPAPHGAPSGTGNERGVLRAISPQLPVTTNFTPSTCANLDYWSWADEVDVVANNNYPPAEDPFNHVDLALSADLSRSLAGGRPWMLMEHSTAAVNWQPRNLAKRPGEMLRNSPSHVAPGSDSVLFFQWLTSRAGAKKFHSAMLPQAGTDSDTRREVSRLGDVLVALREVARSRVLTDVGILSDWNAWWALELEYRPSVDVTAVGTTYRALWRRNLTVGFVRPGAVPEQLRLVLVLDLCSAATAAALRRYVLGGGQLLVGYFSGIVDETGAVPPGGYPGALREVLGLQVKEFHPLPAGTTVHLDQGLPAAPTVTVTVWSERVVPSTCSARAPPGTWPPDRTTTAWTRCSTWSRLRPRCLRGSRQHRGAGPGTSSSCAAHDGRAVLPAGQVLVVREQPPQPPPEVPSVAHLNSRPVSVHPDMV